MPIRCKRRETKFKSEIKLQTVVPKFFECTLPAQFPVIQWHQCQTSLFVCLHVCPLLLLRTAHTSLQDVSDHTRLPEQVCRRRHFLLLENDPCTNTPGMQEMSQQLYLEYESTMIKSFVRVTLCVTQLYRSKEVISWLNIIIRLKHQATSIMTFSYTLWHETKRFYHLLYLITFSPFSWWNGVMKALYLLHVSLKYTSFQDCINEHIFTSVRLFLLSTKFPPNMAAITSHLALSTHLWPYTHCPEICLT